MDRIGFGTNLGLIIILLHLVVGFGFMIYMLSPRKKDKQKEDVNDITR